MSYATGNLQTNDYRIVNVAFGSYVTIEGSGSDVDVKGSTDKDATSVKWRINFGNNSGSIVTSKLYGQCTAYTTANPSKGDTVKTGADKSYRWVIKETNTPGQYLICPSTNATLYWGLTSSTATVQMTDDSGTNAQWKLEHL